MHRSSMVAVILGVLAIGCAGALLFFGTPVPEPAAPSVRASSPRMTLGERQAPQGLSSVARVVGRVLASTGQPIASAEVRLRPWEEGGTSEHAVTHADGRFLLETMAPGPRIFSVTAVGYLDIRAQSHEVPREGMTLDFTLAPAVLLEGIVVDEAGTPLAEAEVAAMTPPWKLTDPSRPSDESIAAEQAGGTTQRLGTYESARFETVTDEDGRFILKLPKGGLHDLVAAAAGFVFTRVEVEAPAKDLRLVLRAGGQVVGTVVSASGEPLQEVELSLTPDGVQSPDTSSASDEQGRFSMRAVTPGRYTLKAAFATGGPHRASQVVQVRPQEKTTVALRMDTGRSVSGTVVDAAGRPLSDAEVKAHSHRDTYAALEKQERGIKVWDSVVRTDSEGRFTVAHLLPGKSVLAVEKPGYVVHEGTREAEDSLETVFETVVTAGATDVKVVLRYLGSFRGRLRRPDGTPITRFFINDSGFRAEDGAFVFPIEEPDLMWLTLEEPAHSRTVREVRVVPGQDVDLGDLILGPGRRLRGRVLDATTSAPVGSATVRVRLTPPSPVPGAEGRWVPALASTLTNPSGVFELEPVESGLLSLSVHHPGYLPLQQRVGSGDEPLELRLSSGARLEGTVKDREGKPATGALLKLVPVANHRGSARVILISEDGTFAVGGLAPGEYVVTIRSSYDSLGNPWSETLVHSEELVVPEVGVLTRDIQPIWRPLSYLIE
ncbi:carboxypeptidase regulatory-like domain-containing protein [Corallococcus terminator]